VGFDVNGMERLSRRHEQAVAFGAAEADVSADFGQQDLTHPFAFGREYVDTVVSGAHPAGVANVRLLIIGREADAVGLEELVRDHGHLTGLGIDAVDGLLEQ
jgi:hypothetical protein